MIQKYFSEMYNSLSKSVNPLIQLHYVHLHNGGLDYDVEDT